MSRRSGKLKYEHENGELEDSELRRRLEGLGYNPGPVTSTTRSVLIRKLTQLEEEKGKVKKAVRASAHLPFSSDDSDSEVVEQPARGRSSVYSLSKAPRAGAASGWSHVGSSKSSVLSPGRRSMPSVFPKTHTVASGNKIREFQEERFDDDDDDDDDAEEPMEAEDMPDQGYGRDVIETERYNNTLSSRYSTHTSTFQPGDSLFKKYGTSTKVTQVINNPHDVPSRRSMGMINVNGQQVPRLSQSERDRLWSGSPLIKGRVGSLYGIDNSSKDWCPSTSSVLSSRETLPLSRGVGAVRSTEIGGATSGDGLRQPYRGQSAGLVSPSSLSYRGGALSSSRRDLDPSSSFASKYQPLGKTQTTKYGISKSGGSALHKAYGDAKLRDVFYKRYLSNVCKFGFCLALLGALVVLALLFTAEDNGGSLDSRDVTVLSSKLSSLGLNLDPAKDFVLSI
uniref:LEM domain-containing protein n=1 Tax=Eptatretus burgeri TaxID=7764 RepID=A0A8C4N432_EPTBU